MVRTVSQNTPRFARAESAGRLSSLSASGCATASSEIMHKRTVFYPRAFFFFRKKRKATPSPIMGRMVISSRRPVSVEAA